MKTSEVTVMEAQPETNTAVVQTIAAGTIVQIPLGLFGFEKVKNYRLLGRPQEAPFFWLEREDDRNLAFLVVSPFEVEAAYQPEIHPDDVAFLGLTAPEDALLLAIVTLESTGRATANLKGPIVINRHTFVGKQAILANAADFSVKHPFPTVG